MELKQLMAGADEEAASALNADTVREKGIDPAEWAETLRSQFGVDRPELRHVERGQDFDLHEGDALAFMAREGVSPETVRAIYEDFHILADNRTGVLADDALDQLEQRYAGRVGKKTAATLREWYVKQIREGGAA